MLVRILGLAAIVLGALLWAGRQHLVASHIGCGFAVSMVVFVLAVIGLTKKAVIPGILGVVFAVLLPVFGFMQLPLTFHTMRPIQVIHIFVGLAIIGVAERLYSAIQSAV
jgi:hypothetical protein